MNEVRYHCGGQLVYVVLKALRMNTHEHIPVIFQPQPFAPGLGDRVRLSGLMYSVYGVTMNFPECDADVYLEPTPPEGFPC